MTQDELLAEIEELRQQNSLLIETTKLNQQLTAENQRLREAIHLGIEFIADVPVPSEDWNSRRLETGQEMIRLKGGG